MNTTEVVRYVRRRKFGKKRRSVYVKYRVVNKNEPNIVNHDDEHSQEYIARRRDSIMNETMKEEEEEEREQEVKPKLEETEIEEKSEPLSPVKSSPKQPTFKQLTLDQFLKRTPTTSPVTDKTKQEQQDESISEKNTKINESISETKTDDNEELSSVVKRPKRLSNASHISKSDTDLVQLANGVSNDAYNKKSNSK